MGLRRYWLAKGELRDARFEVPDGNFDVSFAEAKLVNVDFSGQRFDRFSGCASVFEGCDFSEATLSRVSFGATGYGGGEWDGVEWPETVYRRCTFTRTRLGTDNTHFGNARFEESLFDRARLSNLTSTQEAQFVDCTFRGKIRAVNFWGRFSERDAAVLGRSRNEFRGNDFTAAELIYVAFNHIDLRAQRFPGAPDYAVLDRVGERVAVAKAVVDTWPDGDDKAGAQAALEFLAENTEQYGDEAFIARASLGYKLTPAVRGEIFDLLVGQSDDQQ